MRLSAAILDVDKKEAIAIAPGLSASAPVLADKTQQQVEQTTNISQNDTMVCSVTEPSTDVHAPAAFQTLPCHVTESSITTQSGFRGLPGTVLQQSLETSMPSVPQAVPSSVMTTSLINCSSSLGLSDEGEKENPSKVNSVDKLQRSRERNRIHARKTRQRKKEQMQTLQTRAEELKQEQIRLKQSINEKNTASILVGLFSTATESENAKQNEDPRIESLLRRPAEDIPDASKITELPALILPGQHNSKKTKTDCDMIGKEIPNDGIDYKLLGKDRSKCSPEELDQIRRERNRMHAKRTRDRKRLFMEEMAEMCKKLDEENSLLRSHLQSLDVRVSPNPTPSLSPPPPVSPRTTSSSEVNEVSPTPDTIPAKPASRNGVTFDQIRTLLEAAGSFEKPSSSMTGMISLGCVAASVAATVSAEASSAGASIYDDHDDRSNDSASTDHVAKRRRIAGPAETVISPTVPQSITTAATPVGC